MAHHQEHHQDLLVTMVPEETIANLSVSNESLEEICQTMSNARQNDNVNTNHRPSTVCSAPSGTKIYAVTPEIQQTISLCSNRKSNSFVENKYKCTITSERLGQLKKIVDAAVRDHKVFTIKG